MKRFDGKVGLVAGGGAGIGRAASAVLWLASAEASFVTGTAMLVDGGYAAQ